MLAPILAAYVRSKLLFLWIYPIADLARPPASDGAKGPQGHRQQLRSTLPLPLQRRRDALDPR